MKRNSHQPDRTCRPVARAARNALLTSVVVASSATVALAGLVGGGGSHSWTGTVNSSWHNSGNWNTNQVPAAGDTAIVLGGANNVLLFGDTASIESLFVGGSRAVSNNGHVLSVTSGDASTTVTGLDSSLFITPGGAPFGLITDTLSIESSARLDMAGGWVLVHDQLAMLGGGRIVGHGWVDIDSPSPGAFNGIDGGLLSVTGGDLHVRMLGGGSMALPNTINVLQPDHDLLLVGAILTPINDVNLGSDVQLVVDENWTLGGLLSADTDPGAVSTVSGDGSMFVEGQISVISGSHLRLDGVARFESGSAVVIGSFATLELADWYDTDPGHVTTIALNGRLLIEALHYAGGWQGDIDSMAGTVEVNAPVAMQVSGDLNLGSLFGIRTTIAGSAALSALGNVNAPGLGAIVNGTLDIRPTATMTLGANAQIITNGELLLRAGSDTLGSGQITVNEAGSLVIEETASVDADVVNDGSFRAGSFSNEDYVYIDGSYTQSATGQLRVDLGGPGTMDRDIYETNLDVNLGGELVVTLTDGFVPSVGDSFEIIWANGGVSGAFDAVTGEPGFTVSYSANTVTITFEGVSTCSADITGDNAVDVQDLVALITSWGACEGCAADIDQNGVVDVSDLVQLIIQWGTCS